MLERDQFRQTRFLEIPTFEGGGIQYSVEALRLWWLLDPRFRGDDKECAHLN